MMFTPCKKLSQRRKAEKSSLHLCAFARDSVIASPVVTTTYTVTGTNAYGCTNTATVLVTVDNVGIDEVNVDLADLNIYPNPAINQFTIEFSSSLNKPIELNLFNTLGQKVWIANAVTTSNTNLQKQKYEVNTTSLPAGVYSLEIVTEQGRITRRVVLLK